MQETSNHSSLSQINSNTTTLSSQEIRENQATRNRLGFDESNLVSLLVCILHRDDEDFWGDTEEYSKSITLLPEYEPSSLYPPNYETVERTETLLPEQPPVYNNKEIYIDQSPPSYDQTMIMS